jgi:hypothetical protein
MLINFYYMPNFFLISKRLLFGGLSNTKIMIFLALPPNMYILNEYTYIILCFIGKITQVPTSEYNY